jgi:transmembrane sensor
MRPEADELSRALEGLRNRPIITESRDYARRWERSRARTAHLRVVVGRAGALVAAACVIGYVVFGIRPLQMLVGSPSAATKVAETGVGEMRVLALDDGSRVVLDTSSRLRVAFTPTARDVELLSGQAHFEVARDARRPFRVRTRSAEVVAVGTMFDVAALPTRTTVTLIEGRVKVLTMGDSAKAQPKVEALTPGEQLGITGDGQWLEKTVVNVENVTAWQRGTIVLDDMALPEALDALNRYSTTRIVILGEPLQRQRVSGVFRIGDVETEVSALQRYFDLKETSRSGSEIVLERR